MFSSVISTHSRFLLSKCEASLRGGNNMEQTEAVVLGEKKIEQLSRQPIIESFVSRSQDDKWIVHKTTITDIKPASYFEKVLGQ